MIKRRRIIAYLIFLPAAVFVFFCPVFPQNPPPSTDSGAQAERYRLDTEEEKERLEYKQRKAPVEITEEKEEQPAPAGEAVSFTLKKINISGATVFNPEELFPIYQPYINKKVNFRDMETITKKIKAKYKAEGYATAVVYLPEQEITEGTIEIRIIEGKMGELNIEGNKQFSSSLIRKHIHLKKNDILNVKILQRDILRLNANPDLEIKTVISASHVPETSDVTLQIEENYPHHIGASFDNQGTRLTGKSRSAFTFRSSNLSGNLDTVYINTLLTSGSFGESVNYAAPLTTNGTRFGLDMTYFKMRLGKEYKPDDISGRTQIYTPYVSWELYLSELEEASFNLGMDIKSIKKKTYAKLSSNDQLRQPYFGFDFSKIDSWAGQTTFYPRFTFGTEHFWGASDRNHPTASRAGTGGFVFKYEQGLNRIQKMPWDTYLSLRSQFQAASRTLPSSEQIQLGGANSIRGYPEGDYLADMGGYLSSTWVFPMYLIPETWKVFNSETPLRRQIEPVIFVDIGGGKLKKTLSGEKYDKFLVGVGGGFRINFGRRFYLRLDWAESVGDRPTGGVGPSTFNLTFQSEI